MHRHVGLPLPPFSDSMAIPDDQLHHTLTKDPPFLVVNFHLSIGTVCTGHVRVAERENG